MIKYCLALTAVMGLSTASAIEVTKTNQWLKESPEKTYFYINISPSSESIDTLVQTLLTGEWKMDLVGAKNSSSQMQARLISKVAQPKTPPFNFDKTWFKPATKNSVKAFSLKGSIEEINQFVMDKQRSGYIPIVQANDVNTGTFKYAFIKG